MDVNCLVSFAGKCMSTYLCISKLLIHSSTACKAFYVWCEQCLASGLPDGIFSNKKSRFGVILDGLAMEDVGIFCGHLVSFTAIWYILKPFGLFYGYLLYFSGFGMLHQEYLADRGLTSPLG
jgi:hypothetical protein